MFSIAGSRRRNRSRQLEKVRKGGALARTSRRRRCTAWVRQLVAKAQKNPDWWFLKCRTRFEVQLAADVRLGALPWLHPARRRYKTYDHAVFVTYSLSFMMMLVVAGGLLVASGVARLASLLFFVPPIHMYRHLKGAYELGRFSALARTIALVTFAFVAAGLFVAAAAAIGVM